MTKQIGTVNHHGYRIFDFAGKKESEHRLIVERILGKKLPPLAEVHHVNENKLDNTPSNLVVCPDKAYHMLLHQRQRAYDACGNHNWRKCVFCKQYDDPANMNFSNQGAPRHLECKRAYEREHYARTNSK